MSELDDLDHLFDSKYEDGHHAPAQVECKYCGKDGLKWSETDTGWKLVESKGLIHACRTAKIVKRF